MRGRGVRIDGWHRCGAGERVQLFLGGVESGIEQIFVQFSLGAGR